MKLRQGGFPLPKRGIEPSMPLMVMDALVIEGGHRLHRLLLLLLMVYVLSILFLQLLQPLQRSVGLLWRIDQLWLRS